MLLRNNTIILEDQTNNFKRNGRHNWRRPVAKTGGGCGEKVESEMTKGSNVFTHAGHKVKKLSRTVS